MAVIVGRCAHASAYFQVGILDDDVRNMAIHACIVHAFDWWLLEWHKFRAFSVDGIKLNTPAYINFAQYQKTELY